MRKTNVLFVAALGAVLAAGPALAQGKTVVTHVEGGASVMRGTEQIPVTAGMQVEKGEMIVTDATGKVDVSMNGKVGCRVLASTECVISDDSEAAMQVTIAKGNTILNVDRLPSQSSFRVETPTAVAAVRGTQFWGRVDGRPSGPITTFAVREGSVEVTAKTVGGTFTLEAGQALDIATDGLTQPEVRAALDEEMSAMEQAAEIRTSA